MDRRAKKLIPLFENGAPDDILSTAVLADALEVTPQFLEIGRSPKKNYGPKFVRVGSLVGYRRDHIIEWLKERAELYEARQPAKQTVVLFRMVASP